MDVFNPNITLDPNDASGVNGSNVKTNTPDTTLGSTVNYIIDSNGIARSPQVQERATSLGLNAVAAFEGGVALGAGAQSVAIGCTALGTNSIARVASSTAVGDQAQATAYRAIAIGKCANSTGLNSIAIGTLSHASSQNGTSIGDNAQSSGIDSLAIGTNAVASGLRSTAVGVDASATASFTTAIGSNTVASAAGGTAIGIAAIADAASALAVGINCAAHFTDSIAIGDAAVPGASNSVAIGTGATTLSQHQFVAGGDGFALSDVWFGQGNSVTSGTVGAWTLHGEQDTRADKAGGELKLAGGASTGTGRGGAVRIQTSTSGSTGSTVQTLYDRAVIVARKTIANNTTTELFRLPLTNADCIAFEVKIGVKATDLTRVSSYSGTANVSSIHDGGGYANTIVMTGEAYQATAGTTHAVTITMTQPATNIIAFNINSNVGVYTPSATTCYLSVIIGGETIVAIQ